MSYRIAALETNVAPLKNASQNVSGNEVTIEVTNTEVKCDDRAAAGASFFFWHCRLSLRNLEAVRGGRNYVMRR